VQRPAERNVLGLHVHSHANRASEARHKRFSIGIPIAVSFGKFIPIPYTVITYRGFRGSGSSLRRRFFTCTSTARSNDCAGVPPGSDNFVFASQHLCLQDDSPVNRQSFATELDILRSGTSVRLSVLPLWLGHDASYHHFSSCPRYFVPSTGIRVHLQGGREASKCLLLNRTPLRLHSLKGKFMHQHGRKRASCRAAATSR
jgi:hypothetical protein